MNSSRMSYELMLTRSPELAIWVHIRRERTVLLFYYMDKHDIFGVVYLCCQATPWFLLIHFSKTFSHFVLVSLLIAYEVIAY